MALCARLTLYNQIGLLQTLAMYFTMSSMHQHQFHSSAITSYIRSNTVANFRLLVAASSDAPFVHIKDQLQAWNVQRALGMNLCCYK